MAPRLLSYLSIAGALLARPANAQSWADDRGTPALRELVAVDQTGEPGWIFGSEDLAGDGSATFNAPEQAADLRSAYAATDAERIWLRLYVSATSVPQNLRAFVFVDTDNDARTGGPARAPEIDASLDMAAPSSGYEVALTWPSAGPLAAWRWVQRNGNGNPSAYELVTDGNPLEPLIESGTDLDPLELNAARNGYVQASLKFEPIDLNVSCAAKLLFRSTSGATLRDRDLGQAGACRPGDANRNEVSDLAEPPAACTTDAQCPAHGRCEDGRCVAPVAEAAGASVTLAPGEVVQGGAFTCSNAALPVAASTRWAGLSLFALGFAALRLRRRWRGYAA